MSDEFEKMRISAYKKYRGKCKEFAERAIKDKPHLNLRLVRGYYNCLFDGRQQHWWCVNENGKIYDPTYLQFKDGGLGGYEEFNGTVNKKVDDVHAWLHLPEKPIEFDQDTMLMSKYIKGDYEVD